jgi:hypothetical protein
MGLAVEHDLRVVGPELFVQYWEIQASYFQLSDGPKSRSSFCRVSRRRRRASSLLSNLTAENAGAGATFVASPPISPSCHS